MNIVAIETATSACAIGVRRDDGRQVVRVVDGERRHTETLVPALAEVLVELELSARDVDRVVVDRGPGLFTGLRVGVATAIALAQGTASELVAVTSLELLAHAAFDAGVRGRVVGCVDARRGEVFTQTFALEDEVTTLDDAKVTTARALAIIWATNGAPVTFTGDGVARYRTDLAAVPNGSVHDQLVPSPAVALRIAATREPSVALTPLYLREADAVANFSTRTRA